MSDGVADFANSPQAWPAPFVVEPREKHSRTVILLHGRGSTGEDFAAELFESTFSSGETLRELAPGYKWIFPSCPPRHSVIFDEELTEWYDIRSLVDPEAQMETQKPGMHAALVHIRHLIMEQAAVSPTHDVILGGISQGLTIAAMTVLTGVSSICALIGFSSWMPFRSGIDRALQTGHASGVHLRSKVAHCLISGLSLSIPPSSSSSSSPAFESGTIPVFLGHCLDDDVVDIALGRDLRDILIQLGHRVTWRESSTGGHWINEPHGMNGLKAFLLRYELLSP